MIIGNRIYCRGWTANVIQSFTQVFSTCSCAPICALSLYFFLRSDCCCSGFLTKPLKTKLCVLRPPLLLGIFILLPPLQKHIKIGSPLRRGYKNTFLWGGGKEGIGGGEGKRDQNAATDRVTSFFSSGGWLLYLFPSPSSQRMQRTYYVVVRTCWKSLCGKRKRGEKICDSVSIWDERKKKNFRVFTFDVACCVFLPCSRVISSLRHNLWLLSDRLRRIFLSVGRRAQH